MNWLVTAILACQQNLVQLYSVHGKGLIGHDLLTGDMFYMDLDDSTVALTMAGTGYWEDSMKKGRAGYCTLILNKDQKWIIEEVIELGPED